MFEAGLKSNGNFLLQLLFNLFISKMVRSFKRPDRSAHDLGDLLVRELLIVSHAENSLLLLGKFLYGLAELEFDFIAVEPRILVDLALETVRKALERERGTYFLLVQEVMGWCLSISLQ